MIEFRLKDYGEFDRSESGVSNGKALLNSYRDSIRKDLSSVKENYFYLGLHLLSLYQSNVYAYVFAIPGCDYSNVVRSWCLIDGRSWNVAHSRFFFEYCEKEFGLDKSEVSRLINVVDEFHNENMSGFKYPYSEFGFSALCELLPLTEDQRAAVGTDWTIKQIREYKRGLSNPNEPVPTFQQILDSQKSVATSQQKIFYNLNDVIKFPLSIPVEDYERYNRFSGMSLRCVLDMLINAEAEIAVLRCSSSDISTDD